MKHELLRGNPVTLADGSIVRVPTIPFTQAGFEIARTLDLLGEQNISNEMLLSRMLDACLSGLRLNYPSLKRDDLAAVLDIASAHAVIAALRGETGELE